MRTSRTTVDVGRLRTLAEKANREHRHAQSSAQQAVKHAVEAGELLLKAKEAVGHGNFIKWIEKNFEGKPRHARMYMRLAKAAGQKRIDPDEVSFLTEVEHLLRDQDAEETPQNCRRGLRDEEYEPEVPGEEYQFDDEEEVPCSCCGAKFGGVTLRTVFADPVYHCDACKHCTVACDPLDASRFLYDVLRDLCIDTEDDVVSSYLPSVKAWFRPIRDAMDPEGRYFSQWFWDEYGRDVWIKFLQTPDDQLPEDLRNVLKALRLDRHSIWADPYFVGHFEDLPSHDPVLQMCQNPYCLSCYKHYGIYDRFSD